MIFFEVIITNKSTHSDGIDESKLILHSVYDPSKNESDYNKLEIDSEDDSENDLEYDSEYDSDSEDDSEYDPEYDSEDSKYDSEDSKYDSEDAGYGSEKKKKDLEDNEQLHWKEKPGASTSLTYRVSNLIPLSISPAWDEINSLLKIHLTGSDSLTGLCDEARFARSYLKKTMSVLLKSLTQTKAALFCLEQIQSENIAEDLRIVFAKLLPHTPSSYQN